MNRKVSIVFILIFTLSFVYPSPIQAAPQAAANVLPPLPQIKHPFVRPVLSDTYIANVLFDEAHAYNSSDLWSPGNASIIGGLLLANQIHSDTNLDKNITSSLLAGYDVLVIMYPQIALSSSEIDAIKAFVNNGGGLLLVGLNEGGSGWGYTTTHLNPIAENFGIHFNQDSEHYLITNLPSHEIFTDVQSMSSYADDMKSCTLTVQSPATSLVEYDGKTVVAASTYGSGRILAFGSPGPFMIFLNKELKNPNDHYQLALNVFTWLAQIPQRTVSVPDPFILYVGVGPEPNASWIQDFKPYLGVYHDHTTHSDGRDRPNEQADAALWADLNYFVLTDHIYEKPVTIGGITGAQAADAYIRANHYDLQVVWGQEVSHIQHTTVFPSTANIHNSTHKAVVIEAHKQGAIAIYAHPTIGPSYIEPYMHFDEIGFDGIEIDNSGYILGSPEAGFTHVFVGASDSHNRIKMPLMEMYMFFNETHGYMGNPSGHDLVNAILNRRVIIRDRFNNALIGEKTWIDVLFNYTEQAQNLIQNLTNAITAHENSGNIASLSRYYLKCAIRAFDNGNPYRAIQYAESGLNSKVLNISITFNEYSAIFTETGISKTFSVTINNYNTESITFKAVTKVQNLNLANTEITDITIPANGKYIYNATFSAKNGGYGVVHITIENSSVGDIKQYSVDGAAYYFVPKLEPNPPQANQEAVIGLFATPDTMSRVTSVLVSYNTGNGWENHTLTAETNGYSTLLEALPGGTNVQYKYYAFDHDGHVFTSPVFNTTISNGEEHPSGGYTLGYIPIIAIGGAVAVVIIVYIIKFKK